MALTWEKWKELYEREPPIHADRIEHTAVPPGKGIDNYVKYFPASPTGTPPIVIATTQVASSTAGMVHIEFNKIFADRFQYRLNSTYSGNIDVVVFFAVFYI